MANLKQWIEEAANGEPIEAVVIGEGSENVPGYESHPRNEVLAWETAAPLLDYEFYDGYGIPGCEAITAWTKSRVIFVSKYDGSTSPCWLPRNPIDHEPGMPGGG